MGKKGRPKPKAKQTGKKRSKGKKTVTRRVTKVREQKSTSKEDKYFTNRSEYEPRRDDSDKEEVIEDEMGMVHKLSEDQNNQIDNDEDMIEDEDDIDVFQQTHIDLKFLTGIDLEETKSNKKKRKAEENIEEYYEQHPRLAKEHWKQDGHMLLPLKARSGIIQQPTIHKENDVVDVSNLETMDTEISSSNTNGVHYKESDDIAMATLSTVELLHIRQEKVNAKKLLIANLVSEIMNDPYANVEKLHEMNKLCEEKDRNFSVTVRKLAIVSQLEVFKDIIPGYHIRALSEAEKTAKVSKDVKRIRKFEQGLLQAYQKYLQILEKIITERKTNKHSNQKFTQKDLLMISLECLCDLLTFVPHFNFRTNIMAVLVPQMNNASDNGKVSSLCCETIQSVFKTDPIGEISLEIVQLISKFVKGQLFKVKPSVLETFLSLRLQDADLSRKDDSKTETQKPKNKNRLDKERKKRMSKNDRKRVKEMKKLEHELQETEAVEGKQKSRKMQTEIIKLVFSIYFRVLKTSDVHTLLAPVLAGLSKYTHLINIDFFADLMAVLKTLVNSEEIFPIDKLHCILTAFKILSGQGEVLNIDPQAFYSHLYSTLLNINQVSARSDVIVALQCLDVMLSKRRKQVSIQRLLAYIKRLCTMALQQSPSTSLALLACARSFLQVDSKTGIILDNDFSGSGVFRPDVPDPEYSNADSTTLWEVACFNNHYDPFLRPYSQNIALGNPTQGPGSLPLHFARKSPVQLLEEHREEKRLFNFLNSNSIAKLRQKTKSSNKSNYIGDPLCSVWLQEDLRKCEIWMKSQKTNNRFGV